MFLFFYSCGQKASDPEFAVNTTLGQTGEVSFDTIKSDILTPHCISCHSDVKTETGLMKWVTPGDPENSSFFTVVENGSMPKNQNPLDSKSLELIRNYITNIATPGGSTTGGSSGGSTGGTNGGGISYAEIKSSVLTPYGCTSCHSIGTEAKLSKWINTSNPSSSSLYTTIKSGYMPKGRSAVPSDKQAMVLQYVKDFAGRQ
jgi:hypothetical protein